MSLVIIVTLVLLLAGIIYGGLLAGRAVSGINLLTVPGALVGFVGLCQFLLFTVAVLPVALVLQYLTVDTDGGHIAASFTHAFVVELDNSPVQVSDLEGFNDNSTAIDRLVADVEIAGSNLFTTLMIVLAFSSLWWLTFIILRDARMVLRNLYDRTPFVAENPLRLRRIAGCWIGCWLVYIVYSVVMTLYLQNQLQVTNAELRLVGLPLLMPLFVGGLLLVLAEVFRVGFELKEENRFTV